jgi:hypothetical protein
VLLALVVVGGGIDRKTEGSSTNKGYKISNILNFVAKSLALLNVILYGKYMRNK